MKTMFILFVWPNIIEKIEKSVLKMSLMEILFFLKFLNIALTKWLDSEEETDLTKTS